MGERIDAITARLGSEHTGEVVAAAAALKRIADSEGISIVELLRRVEGEAARPGETLRDALTRLARHGDRLQPHERTLIMALQGREMLTASQAALVMTLDEQLFARAAAAA